MTEVLQAADSDAGTAPRASSNIRHLCRMEIPGGGQVVIDGRYAFVGYQHQPEGTSIFDISDPRQPKMLSTVMTPNLEPGALGACRRGRLPVSAAACADQRRQHAQFH